MTLKNILYRYLSTKDRRHVLGLLKIGPVPFLNNAATILGGGNISENGLEILKQEGVDLAINQSFQQDVEIRNIIYELPKKSNLFDKTTSSSTNTEKYLEHLIKMKQLGSKLYYRPSSRDATNGMFNRYGDIADYYSYEQRFVENNTNILNHCLNSKNAPTPYYRYSIFLAIWWAVAAGCKEIHLYGIELPHVFKEDRVGFGSVTLNIHKGENAYTLLYKLWIDLLDNGIEIKMDEMGAISNLTRIV
jgi:hypothetical protein